MTAAERQAKRRTGLRLVALVVLLLLGQIQSGAHRLVHPLSAKACEVCAFAHHPLALAAPLQPVQPTACEVREPRTGPHRSEPFAAIAVSAERAPPQPSA